MVSDKQEWSEDVVTKSSTETEAESKTEREIVNTTTSRPDADDFDNLLERLVSESFIHCLKHFIARRGRPRVIYSDNGGTFIKTAKWIQHLRKDERVQGFLDQYGITWKFNLSRAPWWGGQFERLIRVVKACMYKVIGGAKLYWKELSETLLDIETQIN